MDLQFYPVDVIALTAEWIDQAGTEAEVDHEMRFQFVNTRVLGGYCLEVGLKCTFGSGNSVLSIPRTSNIHLYYFNTEKKTLITKQYNRPHFVHPAICFANRVKKCKNYCMPFFIQIQLCFIYTAAIVIPKKYCTYYIPVRDSTFRKIKTGIWCTFKSVLQTILRPIATGQT